MRTISEFRIVIASPTDVLEERKAVFESIAELNRQIDGTDVIFRAVGWEEYASPGASIETQTVINKQLFDGFDMLIAIFGAKLGTATRSARSGTVEEIEIALANLDSLFGDQRVQIYFKDSVMSLSKIDPGELAAVLAYRAELGERGVFYTTFEDTQSLAQAVRVNLQRSLNRIPSNKPKNSISPPPDRDNIVTQSNSEIEELGILDLMEMSENSVNEMTAELEKMATVVTQINDETNAQTAILERWTLSDVTTSEKKTAINLFARFLSEKAEELLRTSIRASSLFSDLYEAQLELQALASRSNDPNELAQMKNATRINFSGLLTNSLGAKASVLEFRQIIDNLPRITSQFNRARNRLIAALDSNVAYLDGVERGVANLIAD